MRPTEHEPARGQTETGLGIRISPWRVRNVMVVMAFWLTACTLAQSAYYFVIRDELFRSSFLFDARYGGSAVDWYSAITILGCAVTMALLAGVARQRLLPHPGRWALLALVFLFLSLDEGTELHERANAALDASGYLIAGIYAWVIPAAILVVVTGVAYVPFVRDLPARIRRLIVVAGVTYLTGGLALEALEGKLIFEGELGAADFDRVALEAAENLLEMLGIAILAYALLTYLASVSQGVRLEFEP
jgi:hypothetical protein